MSFLRSRSLAILTSIVLGGAFIAATWHKIGDPPDFAKSVYNFKLVPPSLINLAAIFLPWVELIAGIALVTQLFRRGGALAVAGLSIIFIAALAYNLHRGHPTICGCFGTYEEGLKLTREVKFSKMWREIVLDTGFLLLALQVLVTRRAEPGEPAD